MHVVDANVLVHAANADCAEHLRCRELIEGWRDGAEPWYATWNVLYEFLKVTTHPGILSRPWSTDAAWGFVEGLSASPRFGVLVATPAHRATAAQCLPHVAGLRGNLWHDFHTAVLMREHGIRTIYTRDTDFHRFPWIDVVDPLA